MVDPSEYLTAREREAVHIAGRLNHGHYSVATVKKWTKRAAQYQPLVDQLRPLLAEFMKTECLAEAERKAVMAVRDAQ